MLRILVANQRAGVGKTATAISLAAYLQTKGKRVLVIDTDPQGTLTDCMGLRHKNKTGIAALVGYRFALRECISRYNDQVDVVSSGRDTIFAEAVLGGVIAREETLWHCLKDVEVAYDAVIIDCPPSITILQSSAMYYAKHILVPVDMDHLALSGARGTHAWAGQLNASLSTDIRIVGLLPTHVDRRLQRTEFVLAGLANFSRDSGSEILPAIRTDKAVSKCLRRRITLPDSSPDCDAWSDYQDAFSRLLKIVEDTEVADDPVCDTQSIVPARPVDKKSAVSIGHVDQEERYAIDFTRTAAEARESLDMQCRTEASTIRPKSVPHTETPSVAGLAPSAFGSAPVPPCHDRQIEETRATEPTYPLAPPPSEQCVGTLLRETLRKPIPISSGRKFSEESYRSTEWPPSGGTIGDCEPLRSRANEKADYSINGVERPAGTKLVEVHRCEHGLTVYELEFLDAIWSLAGEADKGAAYRILRKSLSAIARESAAYRPRQVPFSEHTVTRNLSALRTKLCIEIVSPRDSRSHMPTAYRIASRELILARWRYVGYTHALVRGLSVRFPNMNEIAVKAPANGAIVTIDPDSPPPDPPFAA